HVGGEKSEEDRHQDADRFLHAAQVEHGQAGDDGQLHRQLPDVPGQGKVGEDGFAAGGDRGGAGEDVVDEQRRAADHAGGGAEQARGDDVTAAAEREVLDDFRVGGGDDEHRDARRQGQED